MSRFNSFELELILGTLKSAAPLCVTKKVDELMNWTRSNWVNLGQLKIKQFNVRRSQSQTFLFWRKFQSYTACS